MASTQNDSLPPTISTIRRRLISATAGDLPPAGRGDDSGSDSVDFDTLVADGVIRKELEEVTRESQAQDEVEALLQRYQAEKGRQTPPEVRIDPAAAGLPPLSRTTSMRRNGTTSHHGDVGRLGSSLPPLTTNTHVEIEKLRAENTELKRMVTELQQVCAANNPKEWEQHQQEIEQLLTEKDTEIGTLKQQVEEWNEKLKTHRMVPSDDDLAKMSDELEQERCQLAKERKQLDGDREEMKDDEEMLMKQMREMEVGLARDRAELARQRTELQRLHAEVKHEMELLQRGDAGMKERLAQFQRRHSEVFTKTLQPQPPASSTTSATVLPPPPPPTTPPSGKVRESMVRRLFGSG
jgi:hypothetical protein